jgi:hypothetical protein
LTLLEQLKVVPLAAFFQIPPELTSIQHDDLDAGNLYCSETGWYDCIHSCERPELCLCGPGFLHASIVTLLDGGKIPFFW